MSTLIVIAKTPVPGRVKTRLTPPFTAREAALLAAASLADTLQAARQTDAGHRILALDGEPRPSWQDSFTVVPQVSGTLDRRLAAAFQAATRLDPGPVLLIGMDTPQITPVLLHSCLPGDEEDATLGVADDGGFWCLGFRRPRHQDFESLLFDVPMSTDHTGADQLRRLRQAGLRVRLTPTLRDVDVFEDAEHVSTLAPQTRFAARFNALRPLLPAPAGR
ncbi:MAG: DUF2064 domain-containing protein [Catenulisporales bacterium]|nr:DUF2064 domain-containing protein [Catenulisporales bacterium]